MTGTREQSVAEAAQATLLFDGACRFCTLCADWLRVRVMEPVHIVPWQRAALDRLGLDVAQARESVWWIDANGERFAGAQAIARALIGCEGGLRWVGRTLRRPGIRGLAALIYSFVARHRGSLPGAGPELSRSESGAADARGDRSP